MDMDEKELFEQLDKAFEGYVESRSTQDSVVPYDHVEAYRLASDLTEILRQVIPTVVVKNE